MAAANPDGTEEKRSASGSGDACAAEWKLPLWHGVWVTLTCMGNMHDQEQGRIGQSGNCKRKNKRTDRINVRTGREMKCLIGNLCLIDNVRLFA